MSLCIRPVSNKKEHYENLRNFIKNKKNFRKSDNKVFRIVWNTPRNFPDLLGPVSVTPQRPEDRES